jgi:hypothetical protein
MNLCSNQHALNPTSLNFKQSNIELIWCGERSTILSGPYNKIPYTWFIYHIKLILITYVW